MKSPNTKQNVTDPYPNAYKQNLLFLIMLYFQNSSIQNSIFVLMKETDLHIKKAQKQENQEALIYFSDAKKIYRQQWQEVQDDLLILGDKISKHPAYEMFLLSVSSQEFFNEIIVKDIKQGMEKFKTTNHLKLAWEDYKNAHNLAYEIS